ncbi:MAG: porin [Campylobacterota bacterium]|nr:porin [Campylobacterota bacterium]
MKKIALSALVALTIGSVSATADGVKFYADANGQVFTHPAEGRTLINIGSNEDVKEEINKEIKQKASFSRITVVDEKSPEFLLGKATKINMKFVADDNPNMWLKAGVRIQGTFENTRTVNNVSTNGITSIANDAYLRRVRFEVAAGFNKWTSFVMDVRNDKANYGVDNGEGDFNVGDAYVKIKKPFSTSLINFKLFRAKIDVSRTETVKSARVIAYDRPKVADAAAQYISHNRRATNAQMYGNWNKKVHYQVAFGDATYEGKLADGRGKKDGEITSQSFFYGGKVVLSPFDGWEETKRTESYFGVGKHVALGAAFWSVPDIKAKGVTAPGIELNNKLLNIEASAHYKNFFIQAEYFKFYDVVKDWNAAALTTGESSGWYATSEYVIPSLGYIAPFIRYESWDKFETGPGDYKFTSTMGGVNWYLMGNSIKAGLTYTSEKYGVDTGDKDNDIIRLTSQFFF